jgi:endonuclease YncB( thermonuclease family)
LNLPGRIAWLIVASLCAFGLAASGPAIAENDLIGVASVIDGDTIEIHGRRIRLFGIDAPESAQLCVRPTGDQWRCGQQASLALADHIGHHVIRCEPRDVDRYGRVVAVCFDQGEALNRWMVKNGWAVAYRKYAADYLAEEDAARRSRLNIWSGDFDLPWDWRAWQRGR